MSRSRSLNAVFDDIIRNTVGATISRRRDGSPTPSTFSNDSRTPVVEEQQFSEVFHRDRTRRQQQTDSNKLVKFSVGDSQFHTHHNG